MKKALVYDIEGIANRARMRIKNTASVFFLFAAILIAALLLLLFNDDNIYLFIVSVALICISFFVLFKQLNVLKRLNYGCFTGELKKVVKETTNEKIYTGYSIGFPKRKYDHYNKASIRLTLFIEDSEDIHPVVLNSVSEEHVNYYEELGEATLIFGTTYPVKTEPNPERWLCPICGSFNSSGTECRECKNQILI